MIMQGYADHELENTYTLGGCDDNGEPLYNEITEIFLRVTREKRIIFPKIKCRFSKNSPKEYLDEINRSIVKGTSTVLLQNDDATIPALVRAGRPIKEARDYIISGCWGMVTNQEKYDHGSYLNLLKPFEFSIHDLSEKMEKTGLFVEVLDGCDCFEEVYQRTLRNCERLIDAKLNVTRGGGRIFHKVDRFPIFSSTLENCIENHKDFTMGGGKYNDDYQLMFGFPNIIDSLLAIKTLVFDSKKYTLTEFLGAVRSNFDGAEHILTDAKAAPGWGDGSEESMTLANRFNNDLYEICARKEGTYGGKVHMGHLTYTEIRWWGEKTLATPDGRKSGEYFAQGLTPSRLKRIPCVNDVINSMANLDGSTMAANSVVNIILPNNISAENCTAFLYAIAGSAVQSLQLNCTSREELLDAQKHPEKYPDLIVRVTGFSAKFTSLSPEWQEEVITRNFYK
jgi:formate C-acetyltransferase